MGKQDKNEANKRQAYTSHRLVDKLKHVRDFQNSSGMSMDQYCRLHNLSKSTLSTWKKAVDTGKLHEKLQGLTEKMRDVSGEYEEVEKLLVAYINLRNERYEKDHCGMSWIFMHEKALQFAQRVLDKESLAKFKASDGWISRVLKRNDLVGVRLSGEAGEVNTEEAEKAMFTVRKQIYDIAR